jgi:AcrR family transcriptional regulator
MATKRRPLSRDRVLEAAISLADEQGLDAVSMRRVAQTLGVEAMSLYNHVASKADLVAAMVDDVVGEIELPTDTSDWEAAVRTCAVSAHEAFLRHPWACGPAMGPGSMPEGETARLRYMEWLLGTLRRAGFSADLTYHAYHALDSHILGFTMWQLGHALPGDRDLQSLAEELFQLLPPDRFPYLAEHARQHMDAPAGEGEREFDFGLDLILDGLRRNMGAGGFEPP